MQTQPKAALVTGASRGIGRETALKLAEKGYHVFVTSRNLAKLQELSTHSEFIHPYQTSLSSNTEIDELSDFISDITGTLDILINNAGSLINKSFSKTTDEDWAGQLECNLMGPVRLIRGLQSIFNQGGHIVNIGSMGGYQGSSKFPGLTAYSVSKGALSILSECLANELSGISVNCLCLGAVQTEMLENAFPGLQAPVKPEEMGNFIANFALDGQKFFNGKVLPVSLADPK